MAQAVVVTNGEVPIEGRAAVPVYVDNSLPAVGPARNVVVVTSGPMAGGPAQPVVDTTGVLPGVGPALPVYVVSGSLGGGGTAAPFAPTSITGLQFWFSASSLVLNDGDAVASWSDSGSGGHTATQGTAGLRPTYKTGIINSKPVVRFDGGNDRLTTDSITHGIGTGDLTIYAVAQSSNVATAYKTILSTGAGGAPGLYFHNSKINFYWTADHIFAGGVSSNTAYLLCIVRSGTTITLYRNGSADANTFTIGTSMANGAFYLGNEDSGTAATLNGDIAEALLYSGAHNAGQRSQMETYINARYALF